MPCKGRNCTKDNKKALQPLLELHYDSASATIESVKN